MKAKKVSGNRSRINSIYWAMRKRCYDPRTNGYENYGGRGITVCEEWLNSYPAFKEWARSSGYADDLTLDRIDNEKEYAPENCRWTTPKQQNNHKRHNRLLTYNGLTLTYSQWAEITGIPYATIRWRTLHCHWSADQILTIPVRVYRKGNKT